MKPPKVLLTEEDERAIALFINSSDLHKKSNIFRLYSHYEVTQNKKDEMFTLEDKKRLSLLLEVEKIYEKESFEIIQDLYRTSDTEEKISFCKIIQFLKGGSDYILIAHKALQTNSIQELSALSFFNTYPERFFNEDLFNQLVLKVLFFQLPIHQIYGLKNRLTPSLLRMVEDYKSELLSAKRKYPKGITHILNIAEIQNV